MQTNEIESSQALGSPTNGTHNHQQVESACAVAIDEIPAREEMVCICETSF